MTNKRYFKVEYDEEWYLFDSTTISEQLVKEQAEYGYGVFANSLSPSEIVELLNTLHQENHYLSTIRENQQQMILKLKEEKDSLVAVIDENLLKGYHEQSIKHKEAKEKMKEGESSEVSPILDVIFYWTGYIKALEELKEGVSDE